MICHRCQNRRCLTRSKDGATCVVWRCGIEEKKLWFGYQFEYDAGKNMPKSCPDFREQTWDKS